MEKMIFQNHSTVANWSWSTQKDNATVLMSSNSGRPKPNLELARYVAIVLTLGAFYVLAVLTYNSIIDRKRRTISVASVLCLLSAACSVLVCLNKVAELWFGVIICTAYHQSAISIYGIGLAFVYTTLWTRQRRLYSDELLIHTVSKWSRIFSASVIVGIYCLLVSVFATFVTVLQFESDIPPCHIIWYSLASFLPIVVFFIASCFILQLVLFLLIVNPLLRGHNFCQVVVCSSTSNDIHAMLKRLGICACACIFSTILLSIAVLLDAVEAICVYWGNLVALDLIINTIATVFTFVDWKRRLFPMLPYKPRSTKHRMRNSVITEDISSDKTAKMSLCALEVKFTK